MDDPIASIRKNGFVQAPDGQWYKPSKGQRMPSVTTVTPRAVAVSVAIRPTKDVDGLNKTEAEWYELMRRRPYPWIGVQTMTLKLADRCRYTPDFMAIDEAGQLLVFEVKGAFIREDAAVKLKTAARTYPFLKFFMAQKIKGQWHEKEIGV